LGQSVAGWGRGVLVEETVPLGGQLGWSVLVERGEKLFGPGDQAILADAALAGIGTIVPAAVVVGLGDEAGRAGRPG
jgi:hypothetical protein